MHPLQLPLAANGNPAVTNGATNIANIMGAVNFGLNPPQQSCQLPPAAAANPQVAPALPNPPTKTNQRLSAHQAIPQAAATRCPAPRHSSQACRVFNISLITCSSTSLNRQKTSEIVRTIRMGHTAERATDRIYTVCLIFTIMKYLLMVQTMVFRGLTFLALSIHFGKF